MSSLFFRTWRFSTAVRVHEHKTTYQPKTALPRQPMPPPHAKSSTTLFLQALRRAGRASLEICDLNFLSQEMPSRSRFFRLLLVLIAVLGTSSVDVEALQPWQQCGGASNCPAQQQNSGGDTAACEDREWTLVSVWLCSDHCCRAWFDWSATIISSW